MSASPQRKKSDKYFVYLLRCKDRTLYCGIAKNVARRLAEHNSGRGSAYVRSRGGGRVIYIEKKNSLSQALMREAAIKKLPRTQKLKLVTR